MDNLSSQIQQRFFAVIKFEFFQLLSCDYYSSARSTFPVHLLNKLSKIYGSTFDYGLLKTELEVIYSQEDFSGKPVQDIYDYIYQNSLTSAFKEVFRLAKLILTIPSNTASAERSFSALKRINTCLRSTQAQERMSALSIPSVEKELLLQLKQKQTFYDDVIDKFIAQKRRIELCYK